MPKTDVLIAGSGSAGIFAATWLSIFNIPFTILERRSGPLHIGQADGVQVRTVEIYESFGLREELLREAYHILEVCFWGTDEDSAKEGIVRQSRTIDTEKGLSHLPHVILNQAKMNGLMLGKMKNILQEKGKWNEGKANGIEYGWTVKGVEVDESKEDDPDAYCVKVTAEKDGKQDTWEAKYVLVSILPLRLTLLNTNRDKSNMRLLGLRRCPLDYPQSAQLQNDRRHLRHRLGCNGYLPTHQLSRHPTQMHHPQPGGQPPNHPS